jgi:hypothetical protein
MADGKFALTDVSVVINSVDLSDHAFGIDTPQTKEQLDASGFNPTNTKEFLVGQREDSLTVKFRQNPASGKVHQTLSPLFTSGSAFPVAVKFSSASPAANNPILRGTCQLLSYNGLSGDLNQIAELEVTFSPTSGGLTWGTA